MYLFVYYVSGVRGADAEKAAKTLAETYGVFAKGYECTIRDEQQVVDIFGDIDTTGRFLGTDMSKNITGTEPVVDGGMSCQLYPPILNEWKKQQV